MDQHLEQLEAAFRLDPQSANIAANLALSYRAQRRFDMAIPMYERAEELNPNNYRLRLNRAMSMVAWKGDVAAARQIIEEKPKPGDVWYTVGMLLVHLLDREYSEALVWARQFALNTPPLPDLSTIFVAHMVAQHDLDVPDAPSLDDAARAIKQDIEESPSNSGSRARMAVNLEASRGLVLAEAASFALAEHMPRPEAQALVKAAAKSARRPGSLSGDCCMRRPISSLCNGFNWMSSLRLLTTESE